ncbi:protein phosphatase 2C domain-containing protein [Eisenibacter elegans]|uniref:protein phosphatase 2C domain-containing protein n=1 Tax=Eisenibacter elegans TaxID=997 RepID=UPI0004257E91|nr:protein phosphatase 2C domain-containing protein [Eisenibacter elegans]
MQIYTLLRKGEGHPVFCEDFLYHTPADRPWGGRYIVAAVMDGCSSGKDAHFASTLMAKVLQKVLAHSAPLPQDTLVAQIDHLATHWFEAWKHSCKLMQLSTSEALATLLLMVYDTTARKAAVRIAGDGVMMVDNKLYEVDQNNTPNYPAYHWGLEAIDWLREHTQLRLFENPKNIAISTDGVQTFRALQPEPSSPNPMRYLLQDETMQQIPTMLVRKYNILRSKHQQANYDDLGIVRLLCS